MRFVNTKGSSEGFAEWKGTLEEWKDASLEDWAFFAEKLAENHIVVEPYIGIEEDRSEGVWDGVPVRYITEDDVRNYWNSYAPSWPSPEGVRPVWELQD